MRLPLTLPRFRAGRGRGFSFIEALLSIALLGIALLGLAQMFVLSVRNNLKSGEISQATFLAQQKIDYLRTLTAAELNGYPSVSRGESSDEALDANQDGINEYRRLTQVTFANSAYAVKVLVFPANQLGVTAASLYSDPAGHGVRANMNTVITR